MVVGKTLGVGTGAGGVAELHIRALHGGLDHVVFMTEGVGEDDVAAFIDQVHGGLVALLTLRDADLVDILDAELFAGGLGGLHEVEVIGGLLIMQENEADFDFLGFSGGSGDSQGEDHDQSKRERDDLFHSS